MRSGSSFYWEHKQMYDTLALDILNKWDVMLVIVPVKSIEVPVYELLLTA